MSETIAVIVFIILAIILYKMIARYIGIPFLCGILGAAIGAIFGNDGSWMTYAYVGAIIGVIICLIIDFDDAWRTLLGVCLGGGVGWLIGLLFGGSMWSSVVCLAGALIGACIVSPAALSDIRRKSPKTYSPSDTSSGKKKTYTDINGTEWEHQGSYCVQCGYYNNHDYTCSFHANRRVDPFTHVCVSFSR